MKCECVLYNGGTRIVTARGFFVCLCCVGQSGRKFAQPSGTLCQSKKVGDTGRNLWRRPSHRAATDVEIAMSTGRPQGYKGQRGEVRMHWCTLCSLSRPHPAPLLRVPHIGGWDGRPTTVFFRVTESGTPWEYATGTPRIIAYQMAEKKSTNLPTCPPHRRHDKRRAVNTSLQSWESITPRHVLLNVETPVTRKHDVAGCMLIMARSPR
jgi:hypothetical protein